MECIEHRLPAILDLKAASSLHEMLFIQRGADLKLSGVEVQRLGAQCLQLLLSAQMAWKADGKTLTITEPSAELINSVELFGFPDPAIVLGHGPSA